MGNFCGKFFDRNEDGETTKAEVVETVGNALDQLQRVVKIAEKYLQALSNGGINLGQALLILQGVDALIDIIKSGINLFDPITVPEAFIELNQFNANEVADKQEVLDYLQNSLQVFDSLAKKNIESEEINTKKIELKRIIKLIENTEQAPQREKACQSVGMSI